MDKIEEILMQEKGFENNLLRCNICTHFLSVSPVMHNDSLGSICGRESCKQFTTLEGKNYRQNAYEAVARFLNFPCMYKENGCLEKSCFDSIGDHEKNCKFMFFVCPFSVNKFGEKDTDECPFQGEYSTFLDHLEEIHKPHTFENNVQIYIENTIKNNNLFFWRLKNSIVLLLVVHNEKSLYWKVWSGKEIWKNLSYKIEVISKKKQKITASKTQNAELIYPGFFNREIDNSWIETNINQIENFFGLFNAFKIGFYMKGFIVGPSQDVHSLNEECVNCGKSKFTIVECTKSSAHKYCEKCVPMKCEYKTGVKFGTKHICGGRIQGLTHQKLQFMIDYSTRHCKLCNKKVDSLSSHLYNFHNESIFNLDEYHDGFNLNHHLFTFDDHLFLLERKKFANSDLAFSIECLETHSIQYKYELMLMDSSTSCVAITLTHFCNPEFIKPSCILGDSPQVFIPFYVLNNILPSNDYKSMKFKLTISKIDYEIIQT